MGISVIIHTLNEEKNIANCLESVKWADEILVIDMHSTDKTREIAARYTDRILLHPPMQYADPARQFALEQATKEWVLIVDADEMVPRNLKEKLTHVVEQGCYDAVNIPRRNYFFGREMQGAEWGPLQDYNIRFFRKTAMSFTGEIHNFAKIQADARIFKIDDPVCSFIHFAYRDVDHFFEKANRYTTITAEGQGPLLEQPSTRSLILECIREFYWRFFKKQGYKDGVQGLCLSMFMVSYRLMILQKRLLIGRYGTKTPQDAILMEYQALADKTIHEYSL